MPKAGQSASPRRSSKSGAVKVLPTAALAAEAAAREPKVRLASLPENRAATGQRAPACK